MALMAPFFFAYQNQASEPNQVDQPAGLMLVCGDRRSHLLVAVKNPSFVDFTVAYPDGVYTSSRLCCSRKRVTQSPKTSG
jgi:hypothetical protein